MSHQRWCEVDTVVFSLGSITNFRVIRERGEKHFRVKADLNFYEPPSCVYSDQPNNLAYFTFGKRSSEDECRQLIRDVIAGVYDLEIPPLEVKQVSE